MNDDFRKYSTKHLGMNGLALDKYIDITSEMLEWWGLKRDFDTFIDSGVKNIKETIPEYRLPLGIQWKTNN